MELRLVIPLSFPIAIALTAGAPLSAGCLDMDADGICDETDNCRTIGNTDQNDRDRDGLGDLCDPAPDDPTNHGVYEGVIPDGGFGSACQIDALIDNVCDIEGSGALLTISEIDLKALRCEYAVLEGPLQFDDRTGCITLDVTSFTIVEPPCPMEVQQLEFTTYGDGPRIRWGSLPCSHGYDVVRGQVEELGNGNLGNVACLGDDTTDRTPDESLIASLPEPGSAFFYAVRAQGRYGVEHYGRGSSGAERLPSAGDCSAD